MPVETRRRVFGLDLLRAAAILCVTFSHGFLSYNLHLFVDHAAPFLRPAAKWINLTEHAGALGVEIFFVLSGFLIGGILIRGQPDFRPFRSLLLFYGRRWFRTLPLFWFFVIVNVVLELVLANHRMGLVTVVEHALFLKNFQEIRLEFMPEAWSLAVEEWFYLLFPAMLWIGYRLWPGRFEAVFGAAAMFLFLASLGCRIHGAGLPGSNWVNGQRCAVLYRFDSLMTGVIAAWFAHRRPSAWARHAAVCAVLGAVVLGVGYGGIFDWSSLGLPLAADGFYAKTFRFNVISLGVAFLLPMASCWRPRREMFFHTGIRKVALWSYAMYLVNWPLFQVLNAPFLAGWHAAWWADHLFFLFKQLILVAVSAVLYRFYEAPCTELRERLPKWLGLPPRGHAHG